MHKLCFVDMIINDRTVQALVDTGASHNFLKAELAKELGLKVTTSKTK
jgi:predicted aspartyl protease